MRYERNVGNWDECQATFREILDSNIESISGVWFRGQADANWPLESTLERRVGGKYRLLDYYDLASGIKPAIETLTNSAWLLPNATEISTWASSYDARRPGSAVLAYDYLAHLRHNGFPSPLLDWTRSPYVAAFFAFSKPAGRDVAIYAYADMPKNSKVGSSDWPRIDLLGPLVRTHRRHFRQQSAYTICTQYEKDSWYIAKHQSVLDREMPNQDVMWKITLPANERIKVLSELLLSNINAFSLFDSEEALMDALAFEHMDLQEAKREARRAARAAAETR
jgi:hypothetical protein